MIRRNQAAFSLLEIMVVVAIIGIMTATITRVLVRKPTDDWNTLFQNISIMLAQAQQSALLSKKVHRLAFIASSSGGGTITIESEEKNPEKPSLTLYKKITDARIENPYTLPKTVRIRALYVNGISTLNEKSSNGAVYVTKEGMVQPAILHVSHMKGEKEESKKSFILQPFLGRCDIQDGFIKP